ncbi:MAG: acetylornithine/succinylornithine family transaminase [Candidatus Kapabacteria bacterium]|nr:acetylornithine/succinylornithine family transaminase [Candidatus Kapabacteria bacterium]
MNLDKTDTKSGMLIDREHAVVFQTYRRIPVAIERAEGLSIIDVNGKTYLDMLGGFAVNALGHTHPKIVAAIEKQIRQYMHVSNAFYQEPQVVLAEQLQAASGYPRVFFCNSGAEATEGAMKIARRFGTAQSRYDIIGFSGGFHGRTYGPLSIMDKALYKDGMGPFLPNTLVLPFNDIDALEARIDENTCAVMLEFIQGEGGIVEATEEFVSALWQLKERFGFLIIADEVQCGIGRTGDFFAFERYGVQPDIVTIAKAIGGGLPLGAILATNEAAQLFERGMHGTTYGGNPVACAAGSVVVSEVTSGLMKNVQEIGEYFSASLLSLKDKYTHIVREVRGRGCMQGIVVDGDSAPIVSQLLDRGIIANATAGNVIRFLPSYLITRQDIDTLIVALDSIFQLTALEKIQSTHG